MTKALKINQLSSENFEDRVKSVQNKLKELNDEIIKVNQLSAFRGESVNKKLSKFKELSKIIESINFEDILLEIQVERAMLNWFETGE